MKNKFGQQREWVQLANSRKNREACRAARESAGSVSFEEFINFLDDAQLLGTSSLRPRTFIRYRNVPF